jgi:hypothetical protein
MDICKELNLPSIPSEFIQECLDVVYEKEQHDMIQILKTPDIKNFDKTSGETKLVWHNQETIKDSYNLQSKPRDIEWFGDTQQRLCTIRRYPFTKEFYSWVKDNIYQDLDNVKIYQLGHQIWKDGDIIWPHSDGPRGEFVLSYLIDEGGDNVETHWYKIKDRELVLPPATHYVAIKNIDLIHQVRLPLGRWILNDARVLHSVSFMTRPRIAITIGLMESEVDNFLAQHKIEFVKS